MIQKSKLSKNGGLIKAGIFINNLNYYDLHFEFLQIDRIPVYTKVNCSFRKMTYKIITSKQHKQLNKQII